MTQVADRRSNVGRISTGSMNNEGPPTKTLSQSTATNGKTASASGAGRWMSALDEPSIARVQQFIIDTLKNPIRFIKSDSAVVQEVPYKPINDPKAIAERKESDRTTGQAEEIGNRAIRENGEGSTSRRPLSPSKAVSVAKSPEKRLPELFSYRISLHPPKVANERGAGLVNKGNTCYMNSTLQALLHLPPLSYALLMLDTDQLYGRFGAHPVHKFDAIEEMARLAQRTMTKRGNEAPAAPNAFIANLKSYARTLVKFRQEDAHEFLRFLLDAMQYCCLVRAPKSLKPFDPLRETTLIHKIFGGKLRSRVQCGRCKHNSDTYDPILDLSLDIRNLRSNTISSALDNFTSLDHLSGSEKYRCEKCKMSVNATKRFTIHQAPTVLTVHLKRFTLTGQKISKQIAFGEELVLTRNVLSEGRAPQKYILHSVIHHHGGGPNSGHYIASVRGALGNRWYEMNDSSVYPLRSAPVNASNAYILFYVRAPGSALEGVLQHPGVPAVTSASKKRNRDSEQESESRKDKSHRSSPESSNGILAVRDGVVANAASRGPSANKPLRRAVEDDDDLGEAIHTTPSRNGSGYESLVSSGARTNQEVEPMPLSKKQRRKMRASLDLGVRRAADQSDRGTRSLIASPYNVGGRPRPGQDGMRHRMRDRHGQRADELR